MNQSILFVEDVNSMGLRFRLYGCERMRKERLIGEAMVSFANINLELDNNLWLNLEPRCNTSVSIQLAEPIAGFEAVLSINLFSSLSVEQYWMW